MAFNLGLLVLTDLVLKIDVQKKTCLRLRKFQLFILLFMIGNVMSLLNCFNPSIIKKCYSTVVTIPPNILRTIFIAYRCQLQIQNNKNVSIYVIFFINF